MTDQDVWTNFCKWLEILTSVTVIKAHPDGDRPGLPYIMVNMPTVSEVREEAEEIEYVPTGQLTPEGKVEIMANPVVETEWMFSVHAYGTTPSDLLRPIRQARHIEQVGYAMHPITIQEISEIRRVPDFIKNKWEPRAQVDVHLRGLVKDGFIVDTIETYSYNVNRET